MLSVYSQDFVLILSVRGLRTYATSDLKIRRIYRREILTPKISPCAERVNIAAQDKYKKCSEFDVISDTAINIFLA